MQTKVTTRTGSVYVFHRTDDGEWYVSADNKPNPESTSIVDREWPIEPPLLWPPMVGESLMFVSRHRNEPNHPDRMPGGGKITSDVQTVEVL